MTNVVITETDVDQWLKANDPEYGQEQRDRCDTWLQFTVGADRAADWICGHDDEELTLSDIFQSGTPENTGYALASRIAEVDETCHWVGCQEDLYGPQERRGRGKPRKYCQGHQKDAEARRKRLQRMGIKVGEHRNLSYRPKGEAVVSLPVPESLQGLVSDRVVYQPADKAKWIGKPAKGMGGMEVDQYEQSRAVWRSRNLPSRVH
ncbi:hypothetical protein [Streptomyces europaeiscabiei]|uniref:hypothetical protein n=1 Tax=Streptomyces europaeiscabiei TaxID=146819 RepID=UPI0038F7217E